MASSKVSQCTEPFRNLLRQIEIASSQVDHVGKGIKVAVTTGPIVNHPDDAVDAFGNGVGDSCIDEGNDGLLMLAQSANELAHGFQATEQSAFRPVLEKALGSPGGLVGPEVLELLFQALGPIDAAVVFVERLEICGIAPGAR